MIDYFPAAQNLIHLLYFFWSEDLQKLNMLNAISCLCVLTECLSKETNNFKDRVWNFWNENIERLGDVVYYCTEVHVISLTQPLSILDAYVVKCSRLR